MRKAMSHYGVEILSPPLRLLPSCLNADMFTTVAAVDSTAIALQKITKDPLQADIFPYEDANPVVDQHTLAPSPPGVRWGKLVPANLTEFYCECALMLVLS